MSEWRTKTTQFTTENNEVAYMSLFEYEDTLEVMGILLGAFVVVVGLGSLAGMPWTTTDNTTAAAIQTVGILATIVVGLLILAVTYSGEPRELVPGSGE